MPRPTPIAVAALLAAGSTAFGQVRALYTGIPGDPTNDVPGLDETFSDSPNSQFTIGRPTLSPDGSLVGFLADLEVSGTFFDGAYVVAPVADPAAGFAVQEGEAVPGSNDLTVNFDSRLSLLNDGTFAFTATTRQGTTFADSDSLFVFDPATDSLAQVVTGGTPISGGAVEPGGINSPYLAPSGGVGYQAGTTQEGESVVFGGAVLISEQDSIPGAPAPTSVFEFESTHFGNDGQSYLTQARSFPPNRTVDTTVVNGQPVIIGGQLLPDSGFTSVVADTAPAFAAMNEAGIWFARGNNVDGTDWVVIDGDLYATEGDAILPASGELWADFDGITVDPDGNVAVIGETSLGGQAAVYNGSLVLARTGDAVDLDGDGLLDDGLFIRDFSVDDAVLGGGNLVFAARLEDAAGGARGQALLRVAVPEPATLSLLAIPALALLRRR